MYVCVSVRANTSLVCHMDQYVIFILTLLLHWKWIFVSFSIIKLDGDFKVAIFRHANSSANFKVDNGRNLVELLGKS